MGFSLDDFRPFKGIAQYSDAAKAADAKKAGMDMSKPAWQTKNEENHAKDGNPMNLRKK